MSSFSSTEKVKSRPIVLTDVWPEPLFQAPRVLRQKPSRLPYPLSKLYYSQLNRWQGYFREAVDNILVAAPQLSIPIDFKPFENYFSGFNIEYYGFNNTTLPTVHGLHVREGQTIKIYYANNCTKARKRFSVSHEFIHIYQELDPHFRSSMEALPSVEVRARLIERIAENIAAYYLVPAPLLSDAYKREKDIQTLADRFCVSYKTMEICLKEYRLDWKEIDWDNLPF